uniref:GTPase Der n=1 Tax=Eiseniibacteriota bacterium TaxID=2212470 RepID=A0A832MJH0_UNCEI
MPVPVVAIIGRPNVGKSTLFNRVLGERRAVVHDRPGVTRDRNAARAEWNGRAFLLVDTGGFLPTALEGRDAEVRRQAEVAIGLAHLVLFVVDARTGATDLDAAIARSLRRHGTPCILVVNKVDRPDDLVAHDFHRLGIGEPVAVSAEQGHNTGDLLDLVVAQLPPPAGEEARPAASIAIVGRPNVGKSSLVNALLGEQRMVVDERPGTTVDAVDSPWETPAGTFLLVDTAGIRRQAQFSDQSEFYAVVRAYHAMERADVACIVVDAVQGFERQEARLAGQALDAGCSLVVVYNKWDLIEEREAAWKRLLEERARRYPTLADLPSVPLSARSRLHLQRLAPLLMKRVEEHRRRIPTARLNAWLKEAQARRSVPTTRLGHQPRIYYATQTGTAPPEITLFVNQPSRLSDNYRRYLWQHFTGHFGFEGTPVRMKVRKSE